MSSATIGERTYSGKRLGDLRARLRSRRVHFFRGMTYQSCRFCHVWASNAPNGGLWKYGIRHWICDTCFDRLDIVTWTDRDGEQRRKGFRD